VTVAIDEAAQVEFDRAMSRCHELRRATTRPPPCTAANRCLHCSLAPVCLPEEERLARDPGWDTLRLFPPDDERLTLHVLEHGDRVSRAGERLTVWDTTGRKIADHPIAELGQVVVHGNAQVTSQSLAMCFAHGVQVHWLSAGGRYLGGTSASPGGVQRRLRQYEALGQPTLRLNLARRLVATKVRDQLRHLLRVARQDHRRTTAIADGIFRIRASLARLPAAADADTVRGLEGDAAEAYWSAFPDLLLPEVDAAWRPRGRSRRPPQDAANALLSFLYALLYRDSVVAILAVGLEPSFGLLHTPRSAAFPLAEDLMELFRVPLVDLPVVASLNRRQWTAEHVQDLGPGGWLLTETGRRQAIDVYEARKRESWKHPVTGYSLSYARLIELEVRLLEKEYAGQPGLFAKRSLR
jgi:CRISPR-associated protein Cas1